MKPPRRIFRSSVAPRRLGRTLLLGTLGVTAMAVLATVGLSTDLFGGVPATGEHMSAAAGQVAVIGGDTLRLDGKVVRLRGVEAPNRGDVCRGGADCGGAATTALAGLVRDRRVECQMTGRDSMGRPFGICEANGTDLSRAIVAAGWARAQPGAPELADLELRARRLGTGLWAKAGL